ncbi:MAG: acetyl-CoA carboxylase biotin carboxyl carrier protein subunit [Bacteroidota bacterium]
MYTVQLSGGKELRIEQESGNLLIDGQNQTYTLSELRPGSYHLLMDGKTHSVEVLESDRSTKQYLLRINGKTVSVGLRDRFDDLLKRLGMDGAGSQKTGHLKAPMPGLVVEVPVSEGQMINKGDTLLVLEAMKMENALKAAADATVKKILVNKGQAVEKNTVLIELA